MAELMGKATGCSGGRGGSMHLFDVSRGFMGGHAIVGGQLPLSVGLGLAIKYRGEDRAVLCFFGDGAVNEGEFHESMNLAALWGVPVLFFLENNLYGMGSHVDRARAAGRDIFESAAAYKMPAAQIDGMNLMAVKEATHEALGRVRAGGGPVFIEAMTYRFAGHSITDPTNYREQSEVDEWMTKDPIEQFREFSLAEGLMNDEDVGRIGEGVDDTIAEAVQYAEESKEPAVDTLHDHVYA